MLLKSIIHSKFDINGSLNNVDLNFFRELEIYDEA